MRNLDKNNVSPPYCNTGAVNTSEEGLTSCVDWLSFTLKTTDSMADIFTTLGLYSLISDGIEVSGGMYGYSYSFESYKGVKVLFGGTESMGIHFIFSGKGCRYIENLRGFNWHNFINNIKNNYVYNITRLDLAIDDLKGYFSIDRLKEKIKKGELLSKFKKSVFIETVDISTGKSEGHTIYYGKASSMLQIRMYEKHHELTHQGIKHDIKFWNRTEIQLRDDRAYNMFNIISTNNNSVYTKEIKEVLNNYIRFVVAGTDTNKSRWKTYSKWQKFINVIDKLTLTNNDVERSVLEDTYDWINKQTSTSLAMLHSADIDIDKIIQDGYKKLKNEHKIKINDYKKRLSKESQ